MAVRCCSSESRWLGERQDDPELRKIIRFSSPDAHRLTLGWRTMLLSAGTARHSSAVGQASADAAAGLPRPSRRRAQVRGPGPAAHGPTQTRRGAGRALPAAARRKTQRAKCAAPRTWRRRPGLHVCIAYEAVQAARGPSRSAGPVGPTDPRRVGRRAAKGGPGPRSALRGSRAGPADRAGKLAGGSETVPAARATSCRGAHAGRCGKDIGTPD